MLIETEALKEVLVAYAREPMAGCSRCAASDGVCERHHDEVWNRMKYADAISQRVLLTKNDEWVRVPKAGFSPDQPVWAWFPEMGNQTFEDLFKNVVNAQRHFTTKEYWVVKRHLAESPKPPRDKHVQEGTNEGAAKASDGA